MVCTVLTWFIFTVLQESSNLDAIFIVCRQIKNKISMLVFLPTPPPLFLVKSQLFDFLPFPYKTHDKKQPVSTLNIIRKGIAYLFVILFLVDYELLHCEICYWTLQYCETFQTEISIENVSACRWLLLHAGERYGEGWYKKCKAWYANFGKLKFWGHIWITLLWPITFV